MELLPASKQLHLNTFLWSCVIDWIFNLFPRQNIIWSCSLHKWRVHNSRSITKTLYTFTQSRKILVSIFLGVILFFKSLSFSQFLTHDMYSITFSVTLCHTSMSTIVSQKKSDFCCVELWHLVDDGVNNKVPQFQPQQKSEQGIILKTTICSFFSFKVKF